MVLSWAPAEAARDTIAPNAWPDLRRSFVQSSGADGAGGPPTGPPRICHFTSCSFGYSPEHFSRSKWFIIRTSRKTSFNDQGAPLSHEVAVMRI